MKYLAIKNFERFQHYKDRAPLWIKFHTSVLEDFDLLALPDAAQAQLFKLWILASRLDNRLPNNRKFLAAQIFVQKKFYLDELIAAGFLIETDGEAVPLRADWSSRYVPPEIKARVLARTGGRCAICGSDENVEIDHIIPISKGGDGAESNLQALCRKCNRKKRVRIGPAESDATQGYAGATQLDESAEPSRARGEIETEIEKEPTVDAESRIADRLVSDTHRIALTAVVARAGVRSACLASLESMLTGNDPATPQPTIQQFGQALCDFAGNADRWNAALFRGYLKRGVPRAEPANGNGKASNAGRAALMLQSIRELVTESQQPGQAARRYIPKEKVEALGADVFKAYKAIGGADRILGTPADQISFVIRDFTQALEAAHATH